jgi:flagellar biosynthesis protein FlhG
VISLLSGKGGVGKTVLAFNLAERFAAMGKHVLLVDADFTTGNIHILANVACECGVGDFMAGGVPLRAAVTNVKENLDILASTWQGPVELLADSGRVAQLVNNLREEAISYDLVLFDNSSGISNASTIVAHGSDIAVLVLVPELTSISDCYGLFKTLVTADAALDCRLLLNRVISEEEAEFIFTRFGSLTEKFLHRVPHLLGFLSESESYRESIASQKPLSEVAGGSAAADEIAGLCRRLLESVEQRKNRLKASKNKTINNVGLRPI